LSKVIHRLLNKSVLYLIQTK